MGVDDLADKHEADSARRLMALLKNVSDAEFRDIGLEVLRQQRRRVLARDERAPDPLMQFTGAVFQWNEVGIDIVNQRRRLLRAPHARRPRSMRSTLGRADESSASK